MGRRRFLRARTFIFLLRRLRLRRSRAKLIFSCSEGVLGGILLSTSRSTGSGFGVGSGLGAMGVWGLVGVGCCALHWVGKDDGGSGKYCSRVLKSKLVSCVVWRFGVGASSISCRRSRRASSSSTSIVMASSLSGERGCGLLERENGCVLGFDIGLHLVGGRRGEVGCNKLP